MAHCHDAFRSDKRDSPPPSTTLTSLLSNTIEAMPIVEACERQLLDSTEPTSHAHIVPAQTWIVLSTVHLKSGEIRRPQASRPAFVLRCQKS